MLPATRISRPARCVERRTWLPTSLSPLVQRHLILLRALRQSPQRGLAGSNHANPHSISDKTLRHDRIAIPRAVGQ